MNHRPPSINLRLLLVVRQSPSIGNSSGDHKHRRQSFSSSFLLSRPLLGPALAMDRERAQSPPYCCLSHSLVYAAPGALGGLCLGGGRGHCYGDGGRDGGGFLLSGVWRVPFEHMGERLDNAA